MNKVEKIILLEAIKDVQHYDKEIQHFLKEIVESKDEKLLQEWAFVLPLLGALGNIGFATIASDAIGITNNMYDKLVKYVDPYHYGLESAKTLLNTVGVDKPDFLGGGDWGTQFFGKDPNAAEPGWLVNLVKGYSGDKEPEELLQQADEMTKKESKQVLKKMSPEKRREVLKREHGWNDDDIDAWEAENLSEEEDPGTGVGDEAASQIALESAAEEVSGAETLDTDADERFKHVRGDPKLANALKTILSLESQGVSLDKALIQLKDILISGGQSEGAPTAALEEIKSQGSATELYQEDEEGIV